ncbi:MAG: pyridoxal-dependent decarboxylase [Gemmatimonadota bacterium]|nr:pyridoxal-dependent decarboxylase [Gemmatimonadota bacterium]
MADAPRYDLDPVDWDAARRLGHELVDRVARHLAHEEARRWRPLSEGARARFAGSLPREGLGAYAALEELADRLTSHPIGNTHPRFWALVTGSGTWEGALGELLAAATNANANGGQSAAVLLEEQVLGWLKEMLGFPERTSGVLVSGGSVANLVGMLAGLRQQLGPVWGDEGLVGLPRRPVVYTSTEAHFSVGRAVRLMGLGERSLRTVAVDDSRGVRLDALREAIAEDREEERWPVMVVAHAGTVGTGAVDDLQSLVDLAAEEELWLHADGAFGALAALSPATRDRVSGLEGVDSLAFDLHKWLHVPYDAGCVFVRDAEVHRAPFVLEADYVEDLEGGLAQKTTRFSDLGLQQSRSTRAAKVWATIAAHGTDRLGEAVARNVRQAAHLERLVRASDRLQLMAPVTLNVVCFRYVGRRDVQAPADLDALNRQILVELQESGVAVPSHTRIDGRFALRCAITNHRSRDEDFEVLAVAVESIGDRRAKA